MSKLGFLQNIFLFIMLLSLIGCGNSPNVLISEISRDTIAYDETVHINNCGGKADSEQTASRSFATTIEGGAEISAGYQSIVEGSLSAKYSEYRNISKSQKLTAPPNTNMEFVLRWSEDTHAGNITINGETGNYVVKVPVAVEQISTQDLGCDGTQSQEPSSNPTAIPSPVSTQIIASPIPASPKLSIFDITNNNLRTFEYPTTNTPSSCVGAYIETGMTIIDYEFTVPKSWAIIIDSWKAEWSSGSYQNDGILIIIGEWQGTVKVNIGAICAVPVNLLQSNLEIRRKVTGNDGRPEYTIP